MAMLPDEQREALILIGVAGLSYEETAEITGAAIGTIKSRVSRARDRLALIFAEGVILDDHGKPRSSWTLAVTPRSAAPARPFHPPSPCCASTTAFATGEVRVGAIHAPYDPSTRVASDHLPLVMDFAL
jgi:hypothetical protein